MKKHILFTFSFCLFILYSFSQAPPQAMNYSAIAKGSNNQMLANKVIGLRFTILAGGMTGTVVYQETQTDTTDPHGIFNTAIGIGTVVQGAFAAINWGSNTHYLKVELDENGGSNYISVGTTQLLSVPYALYAEKSGTADSSLVGTSSFDPLYPDGLDNITPVNVEVTSSSSYSVPIGQNFYGYFRNTSYTLNSISINGTLINNNVASKAIFGGGTTISHAGVDVVAVNGYTVPATVTPVIITSSSFPYTVPVGKMFFLTGFLQEVLAQSLTIDGMTPAKCFPPNCSPSPPFFVVGAGQVIGGFLGTKDIIYGYLK